MLVKNPLRNQRGVALTVVMLVLLVFTILYAGASYVSNKNLGTSVKTQNYSQEYYNLESGINIMVDQIKTLTQEESAKTTSLSELKFQLTDKIITKGLTGSSLQFQSNGEYIVSLESILTKITVESLSSDDSIHLQLTASSVPTSAGSPSRTLQSALVISSEGTTTTPSFTTEYALFVKDSLDASSLKVYGAPIANSSLTGNLKVGWSTGISGEVHLQTNPETEFAKTAIGLTNCSTAFDSRVVIPDNLSLFNPCTQVVQKDFSQFQPSMKMPDFPEQITNKLPSFTTTGGAKIVMNDGSFKTSSVWSEPGGRIQYEFPQGSSEYYVPKFEVINSQPLELVVGDRDITIVTDRLELSSAFTVVGTGSVTFYVSDTNTNNFLLQGNGNVMGNKDNPQQVIIYDYGRNGGNNKQLIISGSSKYYLSIMSETANLDVGGSAGLFGNFITGGNEVRMSGGTASDATLVYLANPSANFIMDGSSNFRGAIITAGFESSGDVSITYDPSIFENIPFEITSPVDNNLPSGQTQSFTMKQYPVIEQ